jgi:hypothetical protein
MAFKLVNWLSCKRPITVSKSLYESRHNCLRISITTLTADFLRNRESMIDNIFADLWKQVGIKTLLQRCGFHKRSGVAVNPILYKAFS